MRFDIFQTRTDAHVKKGREYLQQANLSRLEHQLAAKHHAALAAMYKQRIAWLEQELANDAPGYGPPLRGAAPRQVEGPKRGLQSVLSWPRAERIDKLPEAT